LSPRRQITLRPREESIVGPIKPDGDTVAVEDGLPGWINGIDDTGCIATNGSTIVMVDRAGTLYLSTDFGLA
jgi:hypothetical protein